MRSVRLTYDNHHYRVEMNDDHPALIYRETPDGGEQYVSSIWPFHYESQKDAVVTETVRKHLDAINRVDP